MNCKLCQQHVRLVDSHIIPEFLYKTLYDSKHRFHEISVDPGERSRLKQKGLRELLLCESCEQKLSVWERYSSRLLNGGVPAVVASEPGYLRISEIDYPKLKLFQLSVLWRAGVSSLEPFSQVQLGPHESRIRAMLLAEDPGDASDYGCIMATMMNGASIQDGIVVPPTWARLLGHKAYRFVCGGIILVYVVSGAQLPRVVVDAFAQPDGTVLVKLQQMAEMKFLMDSVAEMHKLGKLGE
jgi:hypothetical protein